MVHGFMENHLFSFRQLSTLQAACFFSAAKIDVGLHDLLEVLTNPLVICRTGNIRHKINNNSEVEWNPTKERGKLCNKAQSDYYCSFH